MKITVLLASFLLSFSVLAAQLDDGAGGVAAAPQTIAADASAGSGAGLLRGANVQNTVKNMEAKGTFYPNGNLSAGNSSILTFQFNSTGTSASLVIQVGAQVKFRTSCSVSSSGPTMSCTGNSAYSFLNFQITTSGVQGAFRTYTWNGNYSSPYDYPSGMAAWTN